MTRFKSLVLMSIFGVLLAGCNDIFGLDNLEGPEEQLVGRVVFNGEPVGVRVPSNAHQVDLWQVEPDYELEEAIPVYLNMDGEFSAVLFPGTYDVQLRQGEGPWVEDPTRRPVTVSGGTTTFDIPVQPYYTIEEEAFSYSADPGPGGSITVTFRVGQHVTSADVEHVGVYVNTTTFVDQQWNAAREELSLDDIQAALDTNGTITITVDLPDDIHVTPSPDRRDQVFARVGVKTQGVTEMLFTPVYEVGI